MALIINEIVVQTKLVDEEDILDKEEILQLLKKLESENIRLKKQLAVINEKIDNIG